MGDIRQKVALDPLQTARFGKIFNGDREVLRTEGVRYGTGRAQSCPYHTGHLFINPVWVLFWGRLMDQGSDRNLPCDIRIALFVLPLLAVVRTDTLLC